MILGDLRGGGGKPLAFFRGVGVQRMGWAIFWGMKFYLSLFSLNMIVLVGNSLCLNFFEIK